MEKVIIRTHSQELNEFLTTWIKILFPECEIENQWHCQEEAVAPLDTSMSNLFEKGSKSYGKNNSDR